MPNHAISRIRLERIDGSPVTAGEITEFFGRFISVCPNGEKYLDFEKIIPPPDNLWIGYEGGIPEKNLKDIEEAGGFEVVLKALKDGSDITGPDGKIIHPCLTDEQSLERGLVPSMEWNYENWRTKWNSYFCTFSFAEDTKEPHAEITTAWCPPYPVIAELDSRAAVLGCRIRVEFTGEIDCAGDYVDGICRFYESEWDDMKRELVKKNNTPIEIFDIKER